MLRRIPGKSLFARKAHFLKGGPHELSKAAKNRRRRRADAQDERRAEHGNYEEGN